MRVMGKREIGKTSIFDLIVSIMIAELAVISIDNTDEPMIESILPIVLLSITQIVISFVSLKSQTIREIVDGKPSILIENGKIKENEMAKQRYNLDDLLLQLRENKIHSVSQVEFAVLEPTGKLTIFPKEEEGCITRKDVGLPVQESFYMPKILVKDGQIQEKALKEMSQNKFWLKAELKKRTGYSHIKEISFCSIDPDGEWYIDIKDKPKKS
jgi:uncharacterized membrane protein YcaP (DUF421 family)